MTLKLFVCGNLSCVEYTTRTTLSEKTCSLSIPDFSFRVTPSAPRWTEPPSNGEALKVKRGAKRNSSRTTKRVLKIKGSNFLCFSLLEQGLAAGRFAEDAG